MKDFKVTRYTDHPQGALGLLQYGGDGGEWYAIIDARGLPHVFVRCKLIDTAGEETTGYINPLENAEYSETLAGVFGAVTDLRDPDGDTSEADADAGYERMKKRYLDEVANGHWVETGRSCENVPHVCVF